MIPALRNHWPEYLIEAAGLGIFMISACLFTVALEHPASPIRAAIGDPLVRRALMGTAMGLTAVAIIYSPWGQRSGAHINPAVTLTFWSLGKLNGADALFYALAQFAGAAAGMALSHVALGDLLSHDSVRFAATLPGPGGVPTAFAAEVAISFLLMAAVLVFSNARPLMRWTGAIAGVLVLSFITFEAPLSGMSMNPARSFGSAWTGSLWDSFWIYLAAPPVGMLAAAAAVSIAGRSSFVKCAKLHHLNSRRCIFRCGFAAGPASGEAAAAPLQEGEGRLRSAARTA